MYGRRKIDLFRASYALSLWGGHAERPHDECDARATCEFVRVVSAFASLMAMRRISGIDLRIIDGVARLLPWFGIWFLAPADWRDGITAIMAKASSTMETWRCQPCQDVSLWSSPNSFLAVAKLSPIAHRWPSTASSVSIDGAVGHQGVKKARSSSTIRRRTSRPRAKGPDFRRLILRPDRQIRGSTKCSRGPFDPIDPESCLFDHRLYRPIEMATTADGFPSRRQPVLPPTDALIWRQPALDKKQSSARTK